MFHTLLSVSLSDESGKVVAKVLSVFLADRILIPCNEGFVRWQNARGRTQRAASQPWRGACSGIDSQFMNRLPNPSVKLAEPVSQPLAQLIDAWAGPTMAGIRQDGL